MRPPLAANQPLRTEMQAEEILHWLASETPVQTRAEWLHAFSNRKPDAPELVALLGGLRRRMIPVDLTSSRLAGPLLDVCGTGGDRAELFNISTATAFVVAGAGAVVAKHGNRAITSTSGAADTLEALGLSVEQTAAEVARALEQKRFAFLFAPAFHPVFKSIGPVRKQLAEQGIPTVFNLFGPLLNPARPRRQLIGAHHPDQARLIAEVCAHFDYAHVWVVCGEIEETGGFMDELSLCGATRVWEVRQGTVKEGRLESGEVGLDRFPVAELKGRGPRGNAALVERILRGEDEGPCAGIVLFNSAAALVAAGLVEDLGEGMARARASILSGSAASVLDSVRETKSPQL